MFLIFLCGSEKKENIKKTMRRSIPTFSRARNGYKGAVIFAGFVGTVLIALYPIFIYPYLHIEQYRKRFFSYIINLIFVLKNRQKNHNVKIVKESNVKRFNRAICVYGAIHSVLVMINDSIQFENIIFIETKLNLL